MKQTEDKKKKEVFLKIISILVNDTQGLLFYSTGTVRKDGEMNRG